LLQLLFSAWLLILSQAEVQPPSNTPPSPAADTSNAQIDPKDLPPLNPNDFIGTAPAVQQIPIVLKEGENIITIREQLDQAWSLHEGLSQEQLARAFPLIGTSGRLPAPERKAVADWPDGYVGICAIVKNQYQDLREWIEYHQYIGVQKIYVYDNNSTVSCSMSLTCSHFSEEHKP
jgi:hypothetical protein